MLTIERLTPALALAFKSARLRALLDSPSAFASTYASESPRTDAEWADRAAQMNGDRSTCYLAFDGDDACGIVAGFLDREDATKAHLVSMWVAPEHRGTGLGQRLVAMILDWARDRGVRTVYLMVTSNNHGAARFYERLGFTMTGRTEPYPHDAALLDLEMSRDLHGASPTVG
ncbi:MAG: GNAT family N-acetyltransferase [Candidatus Eisenbacteria bacterium]